MSIRHRFWLALIVAPFVLSTACSTAPAPDTLLVSRPGPLAPSGDGPLIIPRPKQVSRTEGPSFRLLSTTRIILADGAGAEERRAATILQHDIAERFHLTLPVVSATEAIRAGGNPAIILSGPTPNPLVVPLQKADALPATPEHAEGYALSVTPQGVAVAGHDAPGLLWGAQTVLQLCADGGSGPLVRAATVSDWPTLSLRAVHLFHGQNATPFHKKLIERIFSRYKMNALFIEAEQVRWDADPTVAPNWAGNRAQVKEEVAFARDHGITVYPLMQSYGHMAWLLGNDRNRSLAEDAQTPYALNYSDPKAVSYIETFNREADDLFAAPGFHIGLDEVMMRGRFPLKSKPKTFPQMYVGAATHWHDFFAKRGKPVFMWADMALCAIEENPDFGTSPTVAEAKAIRDGLPKDLIMADWQYGERTDFPSLKHLKDAGFKNVVAATWYKPKNIQNFSRAAAQVGAMGAIQTTWAGYESDESILQTDKRVQFESMILAADYFWNGGEGPAPDKLPYNAARTFATQWGDGGSGRAVEAKTARVR